MHKYARIDTTTSNVLAWGAHAADVEPSVEEDASADVDEPPDPLRAPDLAATLGTRHSFQKTTVIRPRDHAASLLTQALQSQSEDECLDSSGGSSRYPRRRPSITSNNSSMASTAGFTSDTGITTPPRTTSPSPRQTGAGFVPARTKFAITFAPLPSPPAQPETTPKAAPVQPVVPQTTVPVPPRKRCISFACGNPKPAADASDAGKPNGATRANSTASKTAVPSKPATPAVDPKATITAPEPQPRRTCIKFACPVKPPADSHKPQLATLKIDRSEARRLRKPSPAPDTSVRRFNRGSSSGRSPRPIVRSSAARQPSHSPLAVRSKKFLTAKPEDLHGESSRFHEFASDIPLEDDWIRNSKATVGRRITIDDTLKKELAIRLIGRQAEEEAALEEQDEEADDDAAEDDEDDCDENDTIEGYNENEYDEYDDSSEYNSDEGSDGYNTDNEIGFASSDDEDDGLVLWTVNNEPGHARSRQEYSDNNHSTLQQAGSLIFRRLSVDSHSDSSAFIGLRSIRQDKPKNRELTARPATPALPDSTDFVCGTFDEDRPLEEAYVVHMAARKRGKHQPIPQDIDPSFPTSEPEDEDEIDESLTYKSKNKQGQQGSADDQVWLHGELEDLHHEQLDRAESRRTKDRSPRRFRSPPPPKARGRSPAPRALFEQRHSPGRRFKSPAPKLAAHLSVQADALVSPPASPIGMLTGASGIGCQTLAFRPGLTQAKSLPRPAAIFRHQQQQQHHAQAKPPRRKANNTTSKPMHIRGAMDIVKGLEQKRQRRKEKFQLKYCNRSRKGQIPERRPQRGEGAERMRELGLLMAGKKSHYVLSV